MKGKGFKIAQEILENTKGHIGRSGKKEERRGFSVPLTVYILVNINVGVINLLYFPRGDMVLLPTYRLGVGISMNYLFAVRFLESILKEKEAKAEYLAREMKK